jgi:hypothetical protein
VFFRCYFGVDSRLEQGEFRTTNVYECGQISSLRLSFPKEMVVDPFGVLAAYAGIIHASHLRAHLGHKRYHLVCTCLATTGRKTQPLLNAKWIKMCFQSPPSIRSALIQKYGNPKKQAVSSANALKARSFIQKSVISILCISRKNKNKICAQLGAHS